VRKRILIPPLAPANGRLTRPSQHSAISDERPTGPAAGRRREPPALGWRVDASTALLPLRLFLGGTFAYAGVQKLSDPGFLHPGAPTYIGTQLRGFARGTPGGFLLRAFAIPHPKFAGVGFALIQIAVGLLVVSVVLTRAAAGV